VNEEGGFTSAVRLELASLPLPSEREARAELAGMLLVGGGAVDLGLRAHELAGMRPGDLPLARLCEGELLRLDVPSSAVARRGIALVQRALGIRPRLTAVSTTVGRPHGPAYRVSLPASVVRAREAGRGPRPAAVVDLEAEEGDAETAALLRGVMLIGGSLSAPDRPVHVELSGVTDGVAPLIIGALSQVIPGVHPAHDPSRRRLVLKSGESVADLLAVLGATRAFLTFDDRRLRRQLRGEANRLANADAANLARIARSAGAQIDAIEVAVEQEGWQVFDQDLRETALARLANPSASITELAELLGVARATLHRRLRRVEEAARQVIEGPSSGVAEGGSDSVDDEPRHHSTSPEEDS
jgi:DNA-binding transcriptional regulator WhiA